MEVGGRERLYTYRYTVTTRMTFTLRWAVMRAVLMFYNCEGQSHKTVSTDHKVTGLTQREMTREWQLVEIDFLFFIFLKMGKGGGGGGRRTAGNSNCITVSSMRFYLPWPYGQ